MTHSDHSAANPYYIPSIRDLQTLEVDQQQFVKYSTGRIAPTTTFRRNSIFRLHFEFQQTILTTSVHLNVLNCPHEADWLTNMK